MEPEDLTQFTNDELAERLGSILGNFESAQTELAAVQQEMRRRFPVEAAAPVEV